MRHGKYGIKVRSIGMNRKFWNGKKVLVTGHTGFKGSWLSLWLIEMGAQVIGYSLQPYTHEDNFVKSAISNKLTDIRGDIRDMKLLRIRFPNISQKLFFI